MKKRIVWVLVAIAAAFGLFAVGGAIVANVAEPDYTLVEEQSPFAIRDYAPIIVAEVTRTGGRSEAANKGFGPLAEYIFGGNAPQQKIDMTAPVLQQKAGETIAMTAPVTQQQTGENRWIVRFVMPKEWTLATLPKPNNSEIRILEVPAVRKAVVRFSGFTTDSKLAEKTAELQDFIRARGLKPIGDVEFAFYNPPWTLPFLRRNEIMIAVARD